MESANVQQLFFQHLKGRLPVHISLVDEIAQTLNISNDSAYRRVRGEKPISFDELHKLCTHYKISFDLFIRLQSDAYIFNGILKASTENSFTEWIENILAQLQLINSYKQKQILQLVKDIPPYCTFLIPELAKFKTYFWMKSIFDYKSLKNVQFDLEDPRYNEFDAIEKEIAGLYIKIPITEIWNIESFEGTLRQINFYRESGLFKYDQDVKLLYSKFEELINHLEKQAELGTKFLVGQEPISTSNEYQVYINELIFGDNTIIAELDGSKITFLNCGILFIVHSKNEIFNNAMRDNFDNLMKKSMLISKTGENQRVRFFNKIRQRINQYREL